MAAPILFHDTAQNTYPCLSSHQQKSKVGPGKAKISLYFNTTILFLIANITARYKFATVDNLYPHNKIIQKNFAKQKEEIIHENQRLKLFYLGADQKKFI